LKKTTRRHAPALRTAAQTDAKRIHQLIEQNRQSGHLLPRQLTDIRARIERFIVAVDGHGSIIACGELAPLSHALAEIRSLVVSGRRRGQGLGRRVVEELRLRARVGGYDDLCVFAHEPAYFARLGFSIVPHTWLPEKISTDCCECPLFRRCEQFAMVTDLEPLRERHAPPPSLHV
jgi:amino-acid N-acetyltransferase